MAVTSVIKVLESVRNSYGLTRTLGELELSYRDDGSLHYYVGNSVVVFKILYQGRWRAMRCYTRLCPYIDEIYGDRYLSQELYVYTSKSAGDWVDVVLEEWCEGVTLREAVESAVVAGNRAALCELADAFDALALELLLSPWAHGDITAENIIVTPNKELRLIDFDCKFMPHFQGRNSPELGTAAYQPPSRGVRDFDAGIDDYSIALISTALRALSIDYTLYRTYPFSDGLLLDPVQIHAGESKSLEICCELLLERRMTSAFRVAMLLRKSTLRIAPLVNIFRSRACHNEGHTPLHLTMRDGYVGYANSANESIIPNIYDDGLEFSQGVVMVRLSHLWMAINLCGEVVATFEGCERVKSMRNGVVRVVRNGVLEEVEI